MAEQQKTNNCYVVRKRSDLTDDSERYSVIDTTAVSGFHKEVLTGSREQCEDFAYLMNMARSGRFLVVSAHDSLSR